MSGFGSTPTTSSQSQLSTNQIPISSVAEPGRANGDLTALEGGPGASDANGNRLAPVSTYVKDGNDLTQGAKADTAATDSTSSWSLISLLKGLYAKLAGTLAISAASLPLPSGAATSAKQPALGTAGTASSDVLSVQGIASMTAIKTDGSATTQPVSGTVTANAGSGNFTVAQATGSNLHAVLDAGSAVIGHVIADSGSTTAVTQATASSLNAQVVGSVAQASSNAGNPVKVGGPFNATQPTVTNGQIVDGQYTARGAAIVATGTDTFNAAVTGSVTANAGTNLNTSLLALESGGNLATLAGSVTSSKVQANVSQINGVAPTMGNGVSGTGVQRVTIASDSTGQVALAAGSAVIGHIIADSGSTTAVTQATASNLNAQVVGAAASGATQSGNPVKVGGVFNTTQPTVTTGQAVDLQATARGAAIVATGTDAFAVNASQSGTWNVTNVSGTVSLPTGASTSAKQPALGTAGSASADVISIQGVASMTAVKTDGSGTTQPVSGTVSITANSAVNVAQINGVTTTMGNGVSGTGVQRVTLASDSTGQVTLATGANTIGALTANQSVNTAQVAGSTVATSATGVQKVGLVGNAGATVDSTVGAGTAPTNAMIVGSVYNSSAPAPTSGQAMAMQVDQAGNLRAFPGIALAALSAWNSATSLNATQNIFTNSGAEAVLVQLTQTTTLTAGAITFEVSYDGSNWSTIPASSVLDPTSTTFAQISVPYTVQASTNKAILLNMNGAQGLRIKLSTQITGSGSVTPNYALLPASPADTVVALSPTAANFNATVAQSGTWTVQPGNTANTTAWLMQPVAGTSGGSTASHTISASGTNATNTKNGAGTLYGFCISNSNASARFFKLYNTSSAPTVGTTTPVMTVQLPANATVIRAFPVGLNFGTGISWGLSTGIADNDTGGVSTDISVDLDYK